MNCRKKYKEGFLWVTIILLFFSYGMLSSNKGVLEVVLIEVVNALFIYAMSILLMQITRDMLVILSGIAIFICCPYRIWLGYGNVNCGTSVMFLLAFIILIIDGIIFGTRKVKKIYSIGHLIFGVCGLILSSIMCYKAFFIDVLSWNFDVVSASGFSIMGSPYLIVDGIPGLGMGVIIAIVIVVRSIFVNGGYKNKLLMLDTLLVFCIIAILIYFLDNIHMLSMWEMCLLTGIIVMGLLILDIIIMYVYCIEKIVDKSRKVISTMMLIIALALSIYLENTYIFPEFLM